MDSFSQPFKSGRYPNPHVDGAAHTAAFHGEVDTLRELLHTYGKAGASFSPRGPAAWGPLMVASYAGQVEAVRFLLDEGFPIEERDASLRTPIHAAVKSGHVNVVRLLLERGCDVDRMDDGQRTPLIYAAAAHNVAVMSCLLDAGADPDATDQSLRSPLHYLAEGGRGGQHRGGRGEGRVGEEASAEAGVRLLLLHGAHPGLPDADGHTPLHLAAASSQCMVARLLLGLGGADAARRDREGHTPLSLAKSLEVERMLKASAFHAYCLKRLRCIAAMSAAPAVPAAAPAPAASGGDGGKVIDAAAAPAPGNGGKKQEEEQQEKKREKKEKGEGEEDGAAARAAAATRRVQDAIATSREAMDPPAPLPRLEFPPHPPPGTEAWAGLDAKQRAALVLEEVVLHMKGDLFIELVQGYLWPWNAETSSSAPGSVTWG